MHCFREFPSKLSRPATNKYVEDLARAGAKCFRSYFENIGVAAVQIDSTGRFVRVNDRFCEMTGYSQEELLAGMGPLDLDHPDELVADQTRLGRFFCGEDLRYEAEKRFLRKDGATLWVRVTTTGIRDASEALQLSVSVVSDITSENRSKSPCERMRSV